MHCCSRNKENKGANYNDYFSSIYTLDQCLLFFPLTKRNPFIAIGSRIMYIKKIKLERSVLIQEKKKATGAEFSSPENSYR
jgi:hypothetical protein